MRIFFVERVKVSKKQEKDGKICEQYLIDERNGTERATGKMKQTGKSCLKRLTPSEWEKKIITIDTVFI